MYKWIIYINYPDINISLNSKDTWFDINLNFDILKVGIKEKLFNINW